MNKLSYFWMDLFDAFKYAHKELSMIACRIEILLTIIISMYIILTFKTEGASRNIQPDDLTELNIEELADLEVTSVAKKPQKTSHSAAAVYVITSEDIQRSSATCIPEVLRMVPGLDVARINGSSWAVSARGFNKTYANKLLVLIDGRTCYSPFFSGVFWAAEDTLLEDIDRIEVINGPGASLWGANAVNGIINIITKHSRDTKGAFITSGFGTEDRAFVSTRYGGDISNNKGTYRLYAKGLTRDESIDFNGDPAGDNFFKMQAGFRTDQNISSNNTITIQGDVHVAEINEVSSYPTFESALYSNIEKTENPYSGGNILGRWTHRFSEESDFALQLYYDSLSVEGSGFILKVDIIDGDFQHRFQAGKRNEIIWGLGYRFCSDDTESDDFLTMNPENRTTHLFSTFLQDEITIIENQLFLIVGSKLEHNDYTGFEYQPNTRMLWALNDRHIFWGSVSRAVRSPSRTDSDLYSAFKILPPSTDINPSSLPAEIIYMGNKDIKSETLIAYELGYRMQVNTNMNFEIAAFYNLYDDLADTSITEIYLAPTPPHMVIPLEFKNIIEGDSRGCEFLARWRPYHAIRLQTAYSYFDLKLKPKEANVLGSGMHTMELSPLYQVSINTGINLPWHMETDLWIRYVDDIFDGLIESYTNMDIRFAWNPSTSLTIFLVGQDLLDKSHAEFMEETGRINTAQIERRAYAGIKWTF